jgi:cytochrome c
MIRFRFSKSMQVAALSMLFAGGAAGVAQAEDAKAIAAKSGCLACHGLVNKIVGPGYAEVAAKYKGDKDALAKLTAKVKAGGSGAWGPIPMPPQAAISDEDLKAVLQWILAGAAG